MSLEAQGATPVTAVEDVLTVSPVSPMPGPVPSTTSSTWVCSADSVLRFLVAREPELDAKLVASGGERATQALGSPHPGADMTER